MRKINVVHGSKKFAISLTIAFCIILFLSWRVYQYSTALDAANVEIARANAQIGIANSGAENFTNELRGYFSTLSELRRFQSVYSEQSIILYKQLTVWNTLVNQLNNGVPIPKADLTAAQSAYADQASIFAPKSKAYDRFLANNKQDLEDLGFNVTEERQSIAEMTESIERNIESNRETMISIYE